MTNPVDVDAKSWLASFQSEDVYGPRHVLDTLSSLVASLRVRDFSLSGRRCLEVGCGAHQPLAVASLLYLNGASFVLANDLVPAEDIERSAVLLHEMLKYAARYPTLFHLTPCSVQVYQRRLADFDLDSLARGDLYAGCAHVPIRHVVASLFELLPSTGRFDLIFSRAVLEHFLDFDRLCQSLFELSNDDAVGCHFHDFVDHRYYKSGKYHPWSFLAESEDWAQGVPAADVSNRLRLSEVSAALDRSGFDVHVTWSEREIVPPYILAGIRPPFRHMSDDDLSILRAMLLLQVRNRQPVIPAESLQYHP
jgi:SAM-dependent methyltransferase